MFLKFPYMVLREIPDSPTLGDLFQMFAFQIALPDIFGLDHALLLLLILNQPEIIKGIKAINM